MVQDIGQAFRCKALQLAILTVADLRLQKLGGFLVLHHL
jgi:hypothetical protein